MPSERERQQIAQIGRELRAAAEKAVTGIPLNLQSDLVEVPPKRTGYTASNWIPRVGQPQEEPVGTIGRRGVAAANAGADRGCAALSADRLEAGKVYVTSAYGNAERLNGGSNSQEPRGFVQRSIGDAARKTRI